VKEFDHRHNRLQLKEPCCDLKVTLAYATHSKGGHYFDAKKFSSSEKLRAPESLVCYCQQLLRHTQLFVFGD
jgi:hypothetical protein